MRDQKLKYGKVFVCRTLKLLDHLRHHGFIPFRTATNIHNPKYYVWLFENSAELEAAAKEFLEQ